MKIVRYSQLKFIPASHEVLEKPQVWKKVLLTHKDFVNSRVQMINWAKLPKRKKFKVHYHVDMEEIFIILSGQVEITVGDESAQLLRGDTVLIPAGKMHVMENVGEVDVEYIVIGLVGKGQGKTIVTKL